MLRLFNSQASRLFAVSTTALLAVYLLTAAPDLTFWDSSELATAAQTMGIPHPPGTPLWVLAGRTAAICFSWLSAPFAITMLSVLAAAVTGGVTAVMANRWIGAVSAAGTTLLAGTFFSIWNSATETEVYAVSLLASVAMLWCGERAGSLEMQDDRRRRYRALIAFIVGLAVPLHLSVLVALPGAVAFAWAGRRPTLREVLSWLVLAALGGSAVLVLPVLAANRPTLNSGNPSTPGALLDVLMRKQFDVAGLWPRRAPVWLQLGNLFQWADWQVARGLAPETAASWLRVVFSVIYACLGLSGLVSLRSRDKRSFKAFVVLLASSSIGVVAWLNLRAGPSFGGQFVANGVPHEARERDYFFILFFWSWAVLSGLGVSRLIARGKSASSISYSRSRVRVHGTHLGKAMGITAFVFFIMPLIFNWRIADRSREPDASIPRVYGQLLLNAIPSGGTLFTAGDNDSFPLWYLQQVEGYRRDVSVVVVPLLGARWYREELADAGLLGEEEANPWAGIQPTLRSAVEAARSRNSQIRASLLLTHAERLILDPSAGWLMDGLVYRPSDGLTAGEVGRDDEAASRHRRFVSDDILDPLGAGSDPALRRAQELIRCAVSAQLPQSLLVSQCNGA